MSQIKAKQIKLVAEGDLIVGNVAASGTPLTVGTIGQILVSNGTTPAWGQVSASGINLNQGDVFIGDNSNSAAEASATQQGQIIVSGAGPNFDFAVGNLAAQYVTFSPNTQNNISSTDVQSAIIEVAAERSYIHTSSVDPIADNDSVDTAALGTRFKIGDIWINTLSDNVWHNVSSTATSAVWIRGGGVSGAFVYKGDADASNVGSLPVAPIPGDWWRIGTTGGTENFNGTWDANGEPNGATFNIGDAIVYGDDGDWHKVDNTDPSVAGGDGIIVTGGPSTYTTSVDTDATTITATGGAGTEVAVFNGLANQTLLGNGVGVDASWGYIEDLRDSTGALIVDGVGSGGTPVNFTRIVSSDTGLPVSISSAGSDLNIDLEINAKGTGRISLDGNKMPNGAIAQYSILASNTAAGDLSAVSATDTAGDQILFFNDTTNEIVWTLASNVGGNGWSTITGDSGSAVADNTSDTLSIVGGSGMVTAASDEPETVTISIDIPSLVAESAIDAVTDHFVFYDSSAGIHRKTTLGDMLGGNAGQVGEDESVSVGGVNESFTGFFASTPVSDATITVYFNGLALRATGWSRSGTNLTMVDATNGYAAESGDIIAASYEY